jgi:hypothetical protein
MRPYLKNTHHKKRLVSKRKAKKKGLVEWLKV